MRFFFYVVVVLVCTLGCLNFDFNKEIIENKKENLDIFVNPFTALFFKVYEHL